MSSERGDRIGAAALDRLARSGYLQTTLAEIAAGAGLTEAQLLEEFLTKEAVVAELAEPLLERLDALVRAAGNADSYDPDDVAEILGAYLCVLVDYRQLVEVFLGDPTAVACPSVTRLRLSLTELRDQLAGPAGGLNERIRASSALGAVHRAVTDFSDIELLAMRSVIVETAMAIVVDGYNR